MRTRYSEFNGKPFQLPADIDFGNLFDFILAYGDESLSALKELERDPEQSELLQQLLDQGLLEKARGRYRLTPRAANAMQRRALMEAFSRLKRGTRDGHMSPEHGGGGERLEGTVPFQFGDPVSEIDLGATLRRSLQRAAAQRTDESAPLLPLRLSYDDFERHIVESRTSCSTVVLLDQSGSMARNGRYFHAKKCAMALTALIQQRFGGDTIDIIGFASDAEPIPPDKLPLVMPKPITTYNPVIKQKVLLSQIDKAPPHFTNLHLGLLKAKRVLLRRGGENRMVFIITDGQPTAHVSGDYVHLIYPPHESSHLATLKEAMFLARSGVRICTFALADDYWDMDWLGFVADLGRATRGVTFQCAGGDLTSCVMESYLSGRRKKTYIA